MNLVVVESPAKAKTIKKYLGKGFEVLASYGHVRDLVPKEGAVEPDNNFNMRYQLIERNQRHVKDIEKALRKSDTLYLATDPDREGEAIAWHLSELLKAKKAFRDIPMKRVVFHEITKKAVQTAMDEAHELSMNLVNAQQARRALDYLVGFNLSPLLWKKIRRGLSAGRVQSPALRMIVEREEEIEAFKAREYWTLEADLEADKTAFSSRLVRLQGEDLEKFSITHEKQATAAQQLLSEAGKEGLRVAELKKRQRKRNPAAPFTTSTLQQEASRKLGFGTQRSMRIAQQLYEGIDTGEGAVGLITYMRTDSVNLANEALDEIRELISSKFGADNLPDKPRFFKTKAKNAQEAHEAIRPTSAMRQPDQIKSYLTKDQLRLYELIWKRTIACQMIHATINTVTVELDCGEGNRFRANGSIIAKPGFMQLYREGRDDKKGTDDKDKLLPPMKEGDCIALNQIRSEQHFTEPPPRYGEASLVKTLEEYGIGRPSTYASIISTLQNREYVTLEKKRFQPTDVGRVVSHYLTRFFNNYVDYNYTAGLEDELDAVSRGEMSWLSLLEQMWKPFIELVNGAQDGERFPPPEPISDEVCPKCGGELLKKFGKHGYFIACNNYPDCNYTRNLNEDARDEPEIVEDRKCPECGSDLLIRSGRYGKFIGCSAYPKCKHMEPLEKPQDTGIECPVCKKGSILKRKSRRGKIFYSCSTYPKCDYALWNEPVAGPCPDCGWPILTIKTTKSKGTQIVCPQKECKYAVDAETEEV
ncbi:MAG: type I DNA topoisomerase [gamma proteobacterium symbiont of Bathyaustriella thionipta]|nr:type I DNA topoisomerase [gamma proteobacterium symbiont of Bathyaustriella thionipta]